MQLAWKGYPYLDISNQLVLLEILFLSKTHDFDYVNHFNLINYISSTACVI